MLAINVAFECELVKARLDVIKGRRWSGMFPFDQKDQHSLYPQL